VEEILNVYQDSIEKNKIENNKDLILNKIETAITEINKLTPNLETQVGLLNQIVEKAKLIEDNEISEVKFEPLHIWLEKEFMNKSGISTRMSHYLDAESFIIDSYP